MMEHYQVPKEAMILSCLHCTSVKKLHPSNRNVALYGHHHRTHRTLNVREVDDCGRHRLWLRPESHRGPRDDAQRPLAAQDEVGEVVARRGFDWPLALAAGSVNDVPVGKDDFEVPHIFPDGAVADSVGTTCSGGTHTADGSIGPLNQKATPQLLLKGLQLMGEVQNSDTSRRQNVFGNSKSSELCSREIVYPDRL